MYHGTRCRGYQVESRQISPVWNVSRDGRIFGKRTSFACFVSWEGLVLQYIRVYVCVFMSGVSVVLPALNLWFFYLGVVPATLGFTVWCPHLRAWDVFRTGRGQKRPLVIHSRSIVALVQRAEPEETLERCLKIRRHLAILNPAWERVKLCCVDDVVYVHCQLVSCFYPILFCAVWRTFDTISAAIYAIICFCTYRYAMSVYFVMWLAFRQKTHHQCFECYEKVSFEVEQRAFSGGQRLTDAVIS